MTFDDPQQREIAEKVIRVLQSDKYKSKNYLFLHPFDTNDTPGYIELIGAPLDLQTVTNNLIKKDQYNNETFWIDLANIFHNAIKYHSTRIESKWIAQMATSMLKYMNKERKKAENIVYGIATGDTTEGGAETTEGDGGVVEGEVIPEKKKKKKLKIKLKQEQSSGEQDDDQQQQQAQDIDEEYVSTKKKKKKSSISNNEDNNNNDDNYNEQGPQKIKQNKQEGGKKHMKYKDEDDDDIAELGGGGDDEPKPSKKIKLKRQKSVESILPAADNNEGMEPPLKKPKLKLKLGTSSKQAHGGGGGDDTSSLSPKGEIVIKKKSSNNITLDDDVDDDGATTQQQVPTKKKKKKSSIPVENIEIDDETTINVNKNLNVGMDDDDGGGGEKVKASEEGTVVKKPKIKLKLSIKSKKSNDDATSTAITSVASDVSDSQKVKKHKKDKEGGKSSTLPPVIKIKDEVPGKKLKLFQNKQSSSAQGDDDDDDNNNKNDNDSEMVRLKKEKKKKKLLLAAEREREQQQQEKKHEKKSPKESNSKNDEIDEDSQVLVSTKKKDKKKSKDSSESSSTKLSININPGNRGKELPKGVAESQQQQQQQQQKDEAAAGAAPSSSTAGSTKPSTTGNKSKKNKLKLKKSLAGNNNTALIKKPEPATSSSGGNDGKVRVLSPTVVTSSSDGGKKSKVPSTTSGGNETTSSSGGGGTPYAPSDNNYIQIMKQCTKVMTGLRLRQQKNIKWFASPITDKKILPEYNAKISHPMDMQTVQTNLEKGTYCKTGTGVAGFCLDIRRIFSNALQFNTLMKDSIRPVAIEILQTAEDLFKVFLNTDKVAVSSNTYTPLLYCWKLCIDILNTIYKLENPADGQPLALYFLHPVTYYCAGETPPGYNDKVKKPMDFGTVTANLVEGRYQTVEAFANDCRLVISNCLTYYDGREEGKAYMDQANRLNECLSQQLDQLMRYDKSSKAATDRTKAKEVSSPFPKPSSSMLSAILSDLRAQKYTDKGTKITQPCMQPYEEPVSASTFPDYSQYIFEKMDLTIIDKKVRNGTYEMIEDFEYDVNLLFRNYEEYNLRRNVQHAVTVAKFGARKFRLLLLARYKSLDEPSGIRGEDRRDSVADLSELVKSSQSTSPPGKKLKTETSTSSLENNKKKKNGPRISITVANAAAAAAAAAPEASPVPSSRAKSPGTKKSSLPLAAASSTSQPKQKVSTTSSSTSSTKPNQPVPLHIAIARVKEGFPIRRAVKTLQSWEADCARYFKELMRHPWISAARPKFFFHVPVTLLFPELCDTYAAKIKYPMDLTTIECSLLSGNKYTGPEDFIQDVALVFTNAIRFNRDGRDIGDPLSCAYYDASVHLLKYSRWLSMEVLSDYINDSDHIDPDRDDGLPPFAWSLTAGNRKKARDEMEGLVLKEQIDISLEGDRWTWHESECEKLLKALRHQSDLKYMTFFIAPNYPHDYAAYISKPMDWEKVQRMLKKRQYRVFGDFIEDLRLIFSNALKYNAKHQGTDNVSGRAYESAIYMSQKLEVAISKMLLTVSDRLERERIDHTNAEREIEAAERAEEAQIRAAWKKETNKDGPSEASGAATSNASLKIRNVRRVDQNRDFEIPFFDEEDNGQHESSYFEVVKFQKAMFEKQRLELLNMRKISKAIGSAVIARHIQHQMAQQWVEETTKQQQRQQASDSDPADSKNGPAAEGADKRDDETQTGTDTVVEPSTVLQVLEREDRGLLKLKLNITKPKVKKRKLPAFTFDTEDE